MTDPAPEVVCDAGPLIHLDEVGCLDLLGDFSSVLVPNAVREEVALHRPAMFERSPVTIQIEPSRERLTPVLEALTRTFALDRGEQAALDLARVRLGSIFLTDDAAARLAARTLEVRVHGTVGVLLRAIRTGQRTRAEILQVLQDIPQVSTLYIRKSFLDQVIASVEAEGR